MAIDDAAQRRTRVKLLSRLVLLALAMASLATAIWGGLLRLQWELPAPEANWISYHGQLMICGFLGTLIGLERAAGMAKLWAFAGPALTGIGALSVILGSLSPAGPGMIAGGSAVLVAVFAVLLLRHRSRAIVVMGLGAVAWLVGAVLWLAGLESNRLVLWWAGFAVLTIAGERLELTRFLAPGPRARAAFLVAAGLFGAGVVVSSWSVATGPRLAGAGMVALAAWLLRCDIARKSLGQKGLGRFIAWCLISGYVWLGVSGSMLAVLGLPEPGPLYDAVLHSLFLGFVLSMIFGHASIIFPGVLGVAMPFRRSFYLHVGFLHASLGVRIAGDLAGLPSVRMWGGLLNAAAIAIFVANTLLSVRSGRAVLPARAKT